MPSILLCFKCATSLSIPYASAIGGTLDGRVCDLCEGMKMGADSYLREYTPPTGLLLARIRRLEKAINESSSRLIRAVFPRHVLNPSERKALAEKLSILFTHVE